MEAIQRRYALLSEINEKKASWKIKVKVIRLWKQPMYNDASKTNTIEFVCIDEEGTRCHAIIKRGFLTKFQNIIAENHHYTITNFGVGDATSRWMMCNNEQNINFYKGTVVQPFIPTEDYGTGIDFVDFYDIVNFKVVTKFPIDVIAEIVSRGPMEHIVKEGKQLRYMKMKLKDFAGITLECSLWNTLADQLEEFVLNENNIGRVVIVIQLAKLRIYNAECQISNCLWGSRVWLNSPDIPEIVDFLQRLNERDGPPAADYRVQFIGNQPEASQTEDWTAQMERTNTIDLPYITKDTICMVFGTIKAIEAENSWFYYAHRRCNKVAKPLDEFNENSVPYKNVNKHPYHCKTCSSYVSDVLPRFKVQVRVQDHTGTASLLLFDNAIASLINKSADELHSRPQSDDEPELYPQELDELVDKQFLFKLEITKWNYDDGSKNFTVRKITSDNELIQDFLKRTDPPQETISVADISVGEDGVSQNNISQKDAYSVTADNVVDVEKDKDSAESPLNKRRAEPLEDDDAAFNMSSTKKIRRKMVLSDDE